MVCYSHLFQNFPQFIVIHTVKGFGIVNKAEIGKRKPGEQILDEVRMGINPPNRQMNI